ncbi:MAG: hypothetical protein WKH64_01920 [Chloroflexia bacterium]
MTFELTLLGDAPEERFTTSIYYLDSTGNTEADIRYCGFDATPDCTGNGTVYRQTVALRDSFEYLYVHYTAATGGNGDIFVYRLEPSQDGKVVHVFYDYRTGAGGVADDPPSEPAESVGATLQLTLHGDVPKGEAFYVTYGPGDPEKTTHVILCGTIPETNGRVPFGSKPECTGDGAVYTADDKFVTGDTVYVGWTRVDPSGQYREFHSDVETLNSDATITAWYRFAGADESGQIPDEMPDTGAGGAAGGLPLGSAAAVLLLLTASGYVARKQA